MNLWDSVRGGLLLAPFAAFACAPPARPVDAPPVAESKHVNVTAASFTGTASCSGRGCHGAVTPRNLSPIQLNELTTWIWHDKHAQAFDALASPLADQIVQRLHLKDAQHEAACLGCHVTPQAAAVLVSPDSDPHPLELARQERRFGVGCESCHGTAGTWIDRHTDETWKEEKRSHRAFVDMTDPWQRAKTCLPCHVGAPPAAGAPVRDVNHDLIAAGHPRLAFELTVYHDNLPAHGRRPAPTERTAAQAWAIGQVTTAQAALDLLAFRASPRTKRPWPEFAEYDCFACHHDLREPSWRQTEQGGRSAGALPWGSWYFALAPSLQAAYGMEAETELRMLKQMLGQPRPDVAKVQASVTTLRRELGALAERLRDDPAPEKIGRTLFARLIARDGAAQSWDTTEQALLACQAFAVLERGPGLKGKLDDWVRIMAQPASAFEPALLRPGRLPPRENRPD